MLGGDRMRVLINGDLEPERGVTVTRSVSFVNGVPSFSQVMETVRKLSRAESMDMLQISTKGSLDPA
jgi:hypothetical protein